MNLKQRTRVQAIIGLAEDRFLSVRGWLYKPPDENERTEDDKRVDVWMGLMLAACDAVNDAVTNPTAPKFSEQQIVLMASGFEYLAEARRYIPSGNYPKDESIRNYLMKLWSLHIPFLDRFRGRGHPTEGDKSRFGIT